MSSVLSQTDEKKVIESKKQPAAADVGGGRNNQAGSGATGSTKEDDICDDWEQLDQQKIEKSLKSIKQNSSSTTKPGELFDEESSTKVSRNKITTPSGLQPSRTAGPTQGVTILNSNSNNNTQVPPQSIKILKRPASDKRLSDLLNPNQATQPTPAQPIKTFEQREQEYAQARLRILGSAHPEEDPQQQQSNSQSTSNTSINSNSYSTTTNNNNSSSNNGPLRSVSSQQEFNLNRPGFNNNYMNSRQS